MRFNEAYVEITDDDYPLVNIGGKPVNWGDTNPIIQKAVKKIYAEMVRKGVLDKFKPKEEPWDIVFKSNGDVVISDDFGGSTRVHASQLGLSDEEVEQLKGIGV